jgi:hypothetical protein
MTIFQDICCNTCQSVKDAFQKKGWGWPEHYNFEQCEDSLYTTHPPQENEGAEKKLYEQYLLITIRTPYAGQTMSSNINSHQFKKSINERYY